MFSVSVNCITSLSLDCIFIHFSKKGEGRGNVLGMIHKCYVHSLCKKTNLRLMLKLSLYIVKDITRSWFQKNDVEPIIAIIKNILADMMSLVCCYQYSHDPVEFYRSYPRIQWGIRWVSWCLVEWMTTQVPMPLR